MFSTIISPVDGTEPSEHALQYASELARKHDAKLILVHVLLRGTSVPAMRELAESKGFLEEVKSDIADVEIMPVATAAGVAAPVEVVPDETLERFGQFLLKNAADSAHGIEDIQQRILDGDPAEAILQCAEDENASLIVIGSRGVGDLKSLLLGSVSHKLVQHSKCPCLVVK